VEDLAQLLLEQVGAVEGAVGVRDLGEGGVLALGEVLGVLPKGEAGALELAGPGLLTALAGGVPDLAADLVKGVGGPGDDLEGSTLRVALGQRSATTSAIQSAPSAVTSVICAQRSLPSRSKKRCRVLRSRPGAAQTRRPESWSTTTVR
jgi:hypothetical protein